MRRGGHRDLAALLPEDVLAEVLRHVAVPRWLAISRCVCKAWRAIIDCEGLLHTELPFSGIFIHFQDHPFPEFFTRPPAPCHPAISGKLDFLPSANKARPDTHCYYIKDHCNGLLLVGVSTVELPTHNAFVVNPATRRWDTLPSCHATEIVSHVRYREYLAFDPIMSSHHLVFRIPYLLTPSPWGDACDPLEEASEWPPSLYKLDVFSSRTRRWEDRLFVREGGAVGTVGKTRCPLDYLSYKQSLLSVYWRGSLYVHCQTNFVMRISLSEDKYSMIRPPRTIEGEPYLGRSEKGVYFATFFEGHIRIFILNESCDQTQWMFKYDCDLEPVYAFVEQLQGPWILQDINYDLFYSGLGEIDKEEVVKEASDWISDNDDFDDKRDVGETSQARDVQTYILGFHPYKEIIFLCNLGTSESNVTGFAYHLNSFKVEALGSMYPTFYNHCDESVLDWESLDVHCFPYTPCCWIENAVEEDSESQSSSQT
ncbi:unnamed protein product [Alopecurus aequalis]